MDHEISGEGDPTTSTGSLLGVASQTLAMEKKSGVFSFVSFGSEELSELKVGSLD